MVFLLGAPLKYARTRAGVQHGSKGVSDGQAHARKGCLSAQTRLSGGCLQICSLASILPPLARRFGSTLPRHGS